MPGRTSLSQEAGVPPRILAGSYMDCSQEAEGSAVETRLELLLALLLERLKRLKGREQCSSVSTGTHQDFFSAEAYFLAVTRFYL